MIPVVLTAGTKEVLLQICGKEVDGEEEEEEERGAVRRFVVLNKDEGATTVVGTNKEGTTSPTIEDKHNDLQTPLCLSKKDLNKAALPRTTP